MTLTVSALSGDRFILKEIQAKLVIIVQVLKALSMRIAQPVTNSCIKNNSMMCVHLSSQKLGQLKL